MPQVSSKVLSKLHALRRSISAWMLVRGAALLLVVFVALLALSLWLDWTWMLDKTQRVICIIAALGLLAYLCYRHLFKPLSQRMDEDTLALQVEGRHHEMREGLINALQFSRIKDPRDLGMSPAMVSATIEAGNQAAERTDFRDVLDRKAFNRNLTIAVVMAVVLGATAVGVASTTTLGIWFNRIFLLDDARYPRKTNFDIPLTNGELLLPRGDDWEYLVRVHGEVPDSVYIDFSPKTGSSVTQLMARQGNAIEGATEAQYASTFKNIIEEFSFRIRGGDNRTDWIPVRLVDRPNIDSFDLTLEHPQYTALEPQVVWSIRPAKVTSEDGKDDAAAKKEGKSGTSSLSPLKGSTIRFTAATNKPLEKATLKWDKGTEKMSRELTLEPATVKNVEGRDVAATRFSAVLTPDELTSATYAIDLTDTQGLASKRPTRFIVRMRGDKDPTVKATLLGISSMVVPEARIPIESVLRDDYAITAAALNYQYRGESEESPKGGQRVAFEEKFAEKDVREKGFTHRHDWDLTPLAIPIGSSLTFFVDASDNDTISGPKSGKSAAFFIRVVDAGELRGELKRRQNEQRLEFERLIKVQDDLIAETRIVIATGAAAQGLTPALRAAMMQSQKRQKLTADRCKAIAKQYENLFLEYINNRLETENGEVLTKMGVRVIKPLYDLGDKTILEATNQIDLARKAPDSAAREAAIQKSMELQMAVAVEMREVLKYMDRFSRYQEAVDLIHDLMHGQTDAKRAAQEAIKKMEKGIFGEDKPK